jgi:hypothetical protein
MKTPKKPNTDGDVEFQGGTEASSDSLPEEWWFHRPVGHTLPLKKTWAAATFVRLNYRLTTKPFRARTGTQPMATVERASRFKMNVPLAIAAAIAVAGVAGLLLVDHGPWNRPVVQRPAAVQYSDTAAAAKAAGGTVTETNPKSALEPPAPGPKPVQPAVPDQPPSRP